MLVRIDRTHRFFDGPRNVDFRNFRTKRRLTGSPPPLSPRPLSLSTASQELVLEAAERQRVRNEAILGGQLGDLPLPWVTNRADLSKFLAQVTECQVLVTLASRVRWP
jgi:hypothetical protein